MIWIKDFPIYHKLFDHCLVFDNLFRVISSWISRLMTDEAVVIYSILLFNLDFSCTSRDNRNRTNDSRDDNNLSRIKLIITWRERFEKFNEILTAISRSTFVHICRRVLLIKIKWFFIWIIDSKRRELLTSAERKPLFSLNIRSFINILSEYFNNRSLRINLL